MIPHSLSSRWRMLIPRSGRHKIRLLVIFIAVFALLGTAIFSLRHSTPAMAASNDWPMYLHDYARDAAGTDTIISPSNANQLTLNWAFKTGGPIASASTVVNGVVYVGSWDGYEYALNALTGAQIWKTFLGQTTAPCYPQLAGVSSAAEIDNGVLYVGGGDSNWYALDPATGTILWKVFVGDNTKGWYNWASPLIYNGYAYVGTASVGDCPLIPGQLLQIDLSTHQIVNAANFVPSGQLGGGVWTTPALDTSTNTIYVTTGTRNLPAQTLSEAMIAIDASTLTIKSSWTIPLAQEGVDSDFGSSPILFNDKNGNPLVAAINKNGFIYVFNRNNIAAGPIWEQTATYSGPCPQCGDGSVSSGAFANNTLYYGGGQFSINGQGYAGTVNALDPTTGQFLWQHGAPGGVIPALAYSNGLIFDGAGPTLEVLNAADGTRLWSYTTGGALYAEPTVANGQVFTGGLDDYVYAFGLPGTTQPTPTPDANCPNGWTCQDIGNPSPTGSEVVTGNNWNVQAGGTNVSGTSDQFRFAFQNVSGDTQISTQVASQSVGTGTAQAGVMIRQSTDPTAPYYAVFAESNNKVVVQYRLTAGSTPTTLKLATSATLPLYLEIQRVGDVFQAATSTDGTNYTLIPGDSVTIPMPVATLEGLAAASGTSGTSDTIAYNAVTIQPPGTTPGSTPGPSACPNGWSCSDVGNPITVGDQSLNAGAWTVKGAGVDIQGTKDQFHYVWQTVSGDGTISTHITAQSNTNASAKAGVMIRQSTDPASAYYGAFITPGNGIVVQYRSIWGLRTLVLEQQSGTVPAYLEVTRSGSTYCTYNSTDGTNWNYINGSCVPINMTGPALFGLAVTAHNTGTLGVVNLDTVTVSNTAPAAPTICPTNWNCADIGYPIPTGSQSLSDGVWTILGGGNDIYSIYDRFHYVWQTLAADGIVSAHIGSQGNTSAWAKAGVMMRQTNDPSSMFYAVEATPGNGIVVQYRSTQGGSTQQSAALGTATVPIYLMISRSGNVFSAYTSSNGNSWTLIPGSSVSIAMTGTILAGIAATSHNVSALSTVTFDTAIVTSALSCPVSWSCADIGNPTPAGTQSYANSTWTIQAGGSDIAGSADQFHYTWQSLVGDGTVSSQITSQTNTSSSAKAGVMLRLTTDPGSPFYDIVVKPGGSLYVQYRKAQGSTSQQATSLTNMPLPLYVMVARTGQTFTAYTSSDGNTWTLITGSTVTLTNLTGPLLAGIAATSHNTAKLSTVTFNALTIGTCPVGWSCSDIGNPTPTGDQSENGGSWTITAGGSDIYGTADQFHYAWQSLAADGKVSAQVVAQSNTSIWAKAGVMLRQNNTAGSSFYFAAVTPSNGIVVQYRTTQGGNTQQAVAIPGTVPAYLMVNRAGTTFTTYSSTDGVNWTLVAGSNVTISMTGSVLAGLAVTSHNANTLSTVTFNSVNISAGNTIYACPTGWNCADIGNPTLIGTETLNNGNWTIIGGGSDIYGTADQFHYVWQSLSGTGSVTAHVTAQTNTSSWAKSGVMIRQNSTAGSAYYFAAVTPSNGIAVQYRTAQGASAQGLLTIAGTVPTYLAVAINGTTFTAYTSVDGVNWTPIAGSTETIAMTGSVLAGLAVCSHNANQLDTAAFDTVTIGSTIP